MEVKLDVQNIVSPNHLHSETKRLREEAGDHNEAGIENVVRTDGIYRRWLAAYKDYKLDYYWTYLIREQNKQGEFLSGQIELVATDEHGNLAPILEIPRKGGNTEFFRPTWNVGSAGYWNKPHYSQHLNPVSHKLYYPDVPEINSIEKVFDMVFSRENAEFLLEKKL